MNSADDDTIEEIEEDIRQVRRQKKLDKKKRKIPQHSRELGQIYRAAIDKRRRRLGREYEE